MAVYVVKCTYERIAEADVDIDVDDEEEFEEAIAEMDEDGDIAWTEVSTRHEFVGRLES